MTDIMSFRFNDGTKSGKRKTMIYIRNTGMKDDFSFDACSYEDKEEWLLMYLQGDIDVSIPQLITAWIDILHNDNYAMNSILTVEEITKFIDRNKDYVDKVHQVINSLPLYAIFMFHEPDKESMSMSQFEESDFTEINLMNLSYMAEENAFILLLSPNPPELEQPKFFHKLFTDKDNMYALSSLMKKLPYLNLISTIVMPQDEQQKIANAISAQFKKEEDNNE